MLYIDENIESISIEQALEQVSPQRRLVAMRYRREQDRKLSLAVFLLLKRALREEYGITEVQPFVFGPNGKPELQGLPGIHFNLSHCAHAAACVVGDTPVGVDVESIMPLDDALMARTMSLDEQRLIAAAPHPEVEFTRLWTMKESLLKLIGEGLTDDLPAVLHDAHLYRFSTTISSRYVCTTCQMVSTNQQSNVK